jgi:hypothetical protein
VDTSAGVFAGERALLSLVAATLWPLAPLLSGAVPAQPAVQVALTGCGLVSLLMAALALGPGFSGTRAWEPSLGLGLGLALLPVAALGFLITVYTHHRPLGAVTFAVGALACGVGGVVLARAVLDFRQSRPAAGRVLWFGLAGLVALLAVGAFGALSWSLSGQPELRPALTSLLVGLGLALGAAYAPVPAWASQLRRAALPLCVVVWISTGWLLRSDPDVRAAVKSAPVVAGLVGLALH